MHLLLLALLNSAHAASVLLIWDDSATSTHTLALKASLVAKGHTVTMSTTSETGYNGTNPSPAAFDAVIHLNGTTYTTVMPTAGQTALLTYVQGGGGYIGTEWSAYEQKTYGVNSLRELTLLDRTSGANGALTITITDSTHPVMSGLTSGFTFSAGYNIGSAHSFSSDPVTVIAEDASGNDAVAVREYMAGRVVSFHHSGNWNAYTALSDSDVQTLYANAVDWVGGSCADADGDGYTTCTSDCDDTDASAYPGATEYCDGVDNDCDSTIDEADAVDAALWYYDGDGDSYGDASVSEVACDQPADYVTDDTDCDDAAASSNPGATEYCDGDDDDCDGTVDEADAVDATVWYYDRDTDGYGTVTSVRIACDQPADYVADDTDCDDAAPTTYPGATEYCDGDDNNCDGSVDEATAADASVWYYDRDGDGYGTASSAQVACDQPTNYVLDNTDCDDASYTSYPSAAEVCDLVDNDCDGSIDEASATDASVWYYDGDADGYGDASAAQIACDQPADYVSDATDCDDGASGSYPGATEYCDGDDNDCDGTTDEASAADAATWYADTDGDGYGDGGSSAVACTQPADFVADATDCDDGNNTTFPGAAEYCDGEDDNCDGAVDEATAVDASTWYADADGDGYGDASVTTSACDEPADYSADNTDCDDGDTDRYPGNPEVWYDGIDQDCDGVDDDQDGDGFDLVDDCDDTDGNVFPGALDAYYDGVDSDCAADDDYDADGDGFQSASYGGTDCDDALADTYPGAPDDVYDGRITDCDNVHEYDADQDGHQSAAYGGDDCDDANSDRFPGNEEAWYDGVDQDCDDRDDDQDGDGFPLADDCDDTAPGTNPDAEDAWYDGADSDCAGNDDFDADADGAASAEYDGDDCNDGDAAVNPSAAEVDGNDVDDDCDGVVDVPVVDDTGTEPKDTGDADKTDEGCGCAALPGAPAAGLLLGVAGLVAGRRRRG